MTLGWRSGSLRFLGWSAVFFLTDVDISRNTKKTTTLMSWEVPLVDLEVVVQVDRQSQAVQSSNVSPESFLLNDDPLQGGLQVFILHCWSRFRPEGHVGLFAFWGLRKWNSGNWNNSECSKRFLPNLGPNKTRPSRSASVTPQNLLQFSAMASLLQTHQLSGFKSRLIRFIVENSPTESRLDAFIHFLLLSNRLERNCVHLTWNI